jgi:hypothetical protein
LEVESPLDDIERMVETVQMGLGNRLLQNPVSGRLSIENLAIQQTLFGDNRIAGVVNSQVAIDGTLGSPMLSGTTTVSGGDVTLAGLADAPTTLRVPLVNPRFDLNVQLSDPARLRSTGADLYLLGQAVLTGSLALPDLQADLFLDRGSIRLPLARITLEQGGTVEVRYTQGQFDTFATVLVDMEGRTALTVPRLGDILERYEIDLRIRGDLMRDGGLLLTAQSDPPDLTQDRILALLGHGDIITMVAAGRFDTAAERMFRGAILGAALPALFDPITRQLAQGIGLDYLTLEYNQFDQAALVFGRALGRGWLVQGRRVLTSAPPGVPQPYDLRLVYRPRRLPGILNRFSFWVGTDELRPWKIAIEYGTRF